MTASRTFVIVGAGLAGAKPAEPPADPDVPLEALAGQRRDHRLPTC